MRVAVIEKNITRYMLDEKEDRVLGFLETGELSLSQIHRMFSAHTTATRIRNILRILITEGVVGCRTEKTGGRPRKVFYLTPVKRKNQQITNLKT
jgi:predicted ArsR family transcriptional regulator